MKGFTTNYSSLIRGTRVSALGISLHFVYNCVNLFQDETCYNYIHLSHATRVRQLWERFNEGSKITQLAKLHSRTYGAIKARLIKLKLLQ